MSFRPDNPLTLLVALVSLVSTHQLTAQITRISEIQGSGSASPIVGRQVTVEGVVVGVYLPGRLGGFFLVEEEKDRDGDPETSEGLFIYAPDADPSLQPGQVVRVSGRVAEYSSDGSSSLTELNGVASIQTISRVNVPAPEKLFLPADFERLESLEGMNVEIQTAMVVVENRNLGRYGELRLTPPPSYREISAERPVWPTSWMKPGPDAFDLLTEHRRRMIVLDDGSTEEWPETAPNRSAWSAEDAIRTGSSFDRLVAVVDDRFGEYRLQPLSDGAGTFEPTLRPPPPSFAGGGEEILRVASFNVGNFFLTLSNGESGCGPEQNLDCRGAWTMEERERQEEKLLAAIEGLGADIVALVELENTINVDPAQYLADRLNQISGDTLWRGVRTGIVGTDAIRSGFLYRSDRVKAIGAPSVLDRRIDDRFNDRSNRPSIAQRFRFLVSGGTMTVVVNHLKSKGSDCDQSGDVDREDGQGECNETRMRAAEAIAEWAGNDPTESGDPDVLVLGDFNSYAMEDPLQALEAGGLRRLLPVDSTGNIEGTWGDYSYAFDGMIGSLDHALVTPSLFEQIIGIAPWHINVDEPPLLDYRAGEKPQGVLDLFEPTPWRSSDHDPIVIAVRLRADSMSTGIMEGMERPSRLDLTTPDSGNRTDGGPTEPFHSPRPEEHQPAR